MIISGILSGISYASQLLIFRYLIPVIQDGFFLSFTFVFIASFYGLGSMVYLLITDYEMVISQTGIYYLTTVGSGIFTSIGIVAINLAVSKGPSSICAAIMHSNSILILLYNVFVYNQTINLL